MSETNKLVFRQYMAMWVTGETDKLGSVIGPGYVGHSGASADLDDDIDSLKRHMANFHRANPNIIVDIEQQVAERDLLATRLVARQQDRGHGQAFAGFNISRFADGRIVEEWALWERPSTTADGDR